jgi:multiple sugar transport system substrate-binding protein
MTDNKKFSRRAILRGSAATGAGVFIAGSGFKAFGQEAAPELELPQGAAGKLTVIHRTEYFEAAQTAFRDTVAEFASANNVELDISTTNPESFGDFLGKMTAAVRAGNPPDFAYTSNVSIAQMKLLDLVEDVSDVVEEAVSRYGNIMPGLNAEKVGKIDGKWWAIPLIGTTTAYLFRGDKLKEQGIDPATLKTLEDRRQAALKISGPDFYGWGLTPNQSGDGFGFLILAVQAFGGHFTDETGQIVQFNTPETVAAFEWLKETYDRNGPYAAMLPPGVESWTDTSNNEAYLAGQIGYTHNAFSVYAQSKRDNNPVYPNTVLLTAPQANNGDSRDGGNVGGWMTIFKGAPNAALAKDLALHLLSPENFGKISALGGVLFTPAYANLWTDELIATDPNLGIIKQQVSVENPFLGQYWPANPNAAIDAIRAQGVLEQAVANVIAGRMSPADAVADAHQKMVDIFEDGGIPQP